MEDELKQLMENAQLGNRLEQLKSDLEKKAAEIRRLKNSHEDTFIRVLDQVPDSNFKRAIQAQAEELSGTIKELRQKKSGVEKQSITSQNNLRSVRTTLNEKRTEFQKFNDQVSELTNGEELGSAVKRLEEKVKELQDEKGALSSASLMYEQYIKRLKKEKPCCPLCERDFAAEAESKKLIADLQFKMKKVPIHLERVNAELDEKQEQLRGLVALHLQLDKMEVVKEKEIPNLTKNLEDSQRSITKCQKELDDIEKELLRCEKHCDLCTNILGDMSLLDRLLSETTQLEKDINLISKELPNGWSNTLLQEAEAKKNKSVSEKKLKNEEKIAMQRTLNAYNDQLLQLQSKKNSLDAEDLKLRNSCGQQQQQQDRLVSLRTIEKNLKDELEACKEAVIPLKVIVEEKNNECKLLKDALRNKEREAQLEVDKLFEQLREIQKLSREVQVFEEGNNQAELEKLKNEVKTIENEICSRKIEMESINSKLGDLSKSVVHRRELEDNKAYREKISEKEALKRELEELNKELKNLDFEQLTREKRKLKSEEERIGQRKAEISGQKGGIIGQVTSLKRELSSNMYLDIDTKYKEELVQFHLADHLAGDLLRYAVAMDHAMGVYHVRQMERVNSIIREYWRKIYRGNDIDYIEIIPEQTQLTETRRNYNYKLVQVRGDIQMELRNRCSAGQKMLTSLIVRMALAEVFSNNCGILTLDEPTTNLDRKNIKNLALTLNELIAVKRELRNSNFQLIIITHDRDFLEDLVTFNDIDEYVEVSRNNEGKSQLKVHKVTR